MIEDITRDITIRIYVVMWQLRVHILIRVLWRYGYSNNFFIPPQYEASPKSSKLLQKNLADSVV